MAPRQELHDRLKEITDHVYFQSPNNTVMQFPCIRYELDGDEKEFANNKGYARTKRYQVTVVDQDPDSALPDLVDELPMCRFDRFFVADNLNHYVYNLFF
jgi:hypothetical protein